jgi:hypothetical protein
VDAVDALHIHADIASGISSATPLSTAYANRITQ